MPPETAPTTGPPANPARDERRAMIAALTAQQKQIDLLRGESSALRNALAFVAELAGVADHPHIAALGVKKVADVDNPAQPIPGKGSEAPSQTTDQALAPLATDSVDAKGETPGANAGVTPAATTDVTKPGEVMAAPESPSQDVEKMVAGTDTVPSPSQARIPIKVEAPPPPEPTKTMFADTGWTASKEGEGNQRMFASIHLARLRKSAGIEDGTVDDLALGQQIYDDPAMSDVAIATETATLGKVIERRAGSQQRQGSRSLVPQKAAGVQRTMPSLAGADDGLAVTASDSSVSDDELGFMG